MKWLFSVLAVSIVLISAPVVAEKCAWQTGDDIADRFKSAETPGDFDSILHRIQLEANQNNSAAQFILAMIYYYGDLLPRDEQKSLMLLRLAAVQGQSEAATMLRHQFNEKVGEGLDYSEDEPMLRRAAEQGDAVAQMQLYDMYWFGMGVERIQAEAVKWVRMAAEQGDPKAQDALGRLYLHGIGVPEDYTEAMALLHKAAEQNLATAQYMLSLLYSTEETMVTAYAWTRLAAENCSSEAIRTKEYLERDLTPEQIEKGKALADQLRPSDNQAQ